VQLISVNDYFTVRRASLLNDLDRQLLTDLYQPLIGYQSLALYISLWSLLDRDLISQPMSIEQILQMMLMPLNRFTPAKDGLEAVGLIKTYRKKNKDSVEYVFELYAPKSPYEFFDDALFKGLLVKYLGEKQVQRLIAYYASSDPLQGYEDVSTSFGKVFHPELDDPSFLIETKRNIINRTSGTIKSTFEISTFIKELKIKGNVKDDLLKKADLVEIERIGNLFGLDELAMAELVLASLTNNSKNPIDYKRLINLAGDEIDFPFIRQRRAISSNITSENDLSKKIRLMDEMSCRDYLRIKQNNTPPTAPDLSLVNDISRKLNLPNPVINALIDYVLDVKDNTLPRSYTEKIAGSLARQNILTSIDAIDYLRKVNLKMSKYQSKDKKTSTKDKGSDKEDVDIDKLLEEFEKGKQK
jgi:replication initiation and membrane attachment protein